MTLRKVVWCNLWNISRANDADGVGSQTHLTEAVGLTGKTLCGRNFPAVKGYPSTFRYCKRCVKIAYGKGFEQGFTKSLEYVANREAE